MLMDQYFEAMKGVLAKVETTQRDAIEKTAEEIARRLAEGALWHLLDTGHMLMFEGVGRTGGMMAVRPIKITCEIENPVRYRPGASSGAVGYDSISGFADYVIGRSSIVAGDIVMLGSVSGYNYFPVDLALKTREMGCLTVALTSVEYSSRLTSRHPSGKRLCWITARTTGIHWCRWRSWGRQSVRRAVSAPAISCGHFRAQWWKSCWPWGKSRVCISRTTCRAQRRSTSVGWISMKRKGIDSPC